MPSITPPNATEVQNVVEERLADFDGAGGLQETVTIDFRGQQTSLPVISMPVSLLKYNPDTHRIRAQRDLDPVRDRELRDAPYGTAAQQYLHDLLKGSPADPGKTDPSFEVLKEDLRDNGQNDPGIITRTGVLINGNTRRAALKELGQTDIRVAVLPGSAGLDDWHNVELALQLRRDHRRDYSFMNLLLAIDERLAGGRSPGAIQSDFRMRPSTFDRNVWILQFVREAIQRSATDAGGGKPAISLRLIDFEADQGQLEELYRAWNALKSKSSDDAEALKEQRLLAMVLDKSKTDLRLIEPDFADKYLKHVVPEPIPGKQNLTVVPGTAISTPGPSAKLEALRVFTTSILQAKAIAQSPGHAGHETITAATRTLTKIDAELNSALDKAGKNSRITKRRFAASERLTDAAEAFDLAATAVAEARATSSFEVEDIEDALNQIQRSVTKFAQLVSRSGPVEGDRPGLAWLRSAASLPDTPV